MSEYPDHLNPFKDSEKNKLGRTLSRSFRGFKGFIRQSFRKKKSKSSKNEDFADVEIRKSQDFSYNTIRNNVMSMPSTYNTITSPLLPRSRFKERLYRSSLNTYDERCNPFAEEGLNPFDEPPVPYRRRKSKKNAPIPPSSSNPDVYLGHKMKGSSKWSLTSTESDYTLDDKSEYSGDVTYYPQSLKECLDNFNKEMDTLNKESLEIGVSAPNILECDRDGQICKGEIENIRKSKIKIDFTDEEENREVNNNKTVLLNSKEVIPENLETKTPIIIVTEEYRENSEDETNTDEREEKLNKLNEVQSEHSKYYDEETNREIREPTHVEYKLATQKLEYENVESEKNHESNENYEGTAKEPEEHIKSECSESSTTSSMILLKTNSIPRPNKQEEYDDVVKEKDMMEKLNVHDVTLEYIDEDNSSIRQSDENREENNQSHETLAMPTTNAKDHSHIPKQRKYKLDKLILLGENSTTE